jgi:hypothetical protein
MAEKRTGATGVTAGQEWDAIPLYEQILEAKPRDVAALEILTRAYHSLGDVSKACQYGLRLSDVVLQDDDVGRMSDIRALLQPHADANAAIGEMVQRLNACLRAHEAAAEAAAEELAAQAAAQSSRGQTAASAPASRLRMVASPAAKPGARAAAAPPAAAVPPAGREPDRPSGASPSSGNTPIPTADRMGAGRDLPRHPAANSAAVDAALHRVAAFLGGEGAGPASAAPPAPAAAPQPTARAAAAKVRKANPLSDAGRRRTIISEEMNLAWDLQQEGLLSEEHYAAVVRDLTDLSSSEVPVTISALHVLHFRNVANLDQVLLHVAAKSETVLIPLASFDPQGIAFGVLPIEYMTVQGVIPFERLGTDLLVALLNPLNQRVRHEVQDLADARCHFFLVSPSEFDATLETVKNRYPGVAALRKQAAAE